MLLLCFYITHVAAHANINIQLVVLSAVDVGINESEEILVVTCYINFLEANQNVLIKTADHSFHTSDLHKTSEMMLAYFSVTNLY
jgi:hypothetical protein